MKERAIKIALTLLAALALFVPGDAQAGKSLLSVLFPYLFPAEQEETGLSERLGADELAPFARDKAADNTETTISLDKPHRLSEDLENWLMQQISVILNINPYEYEEHLNKIKPIMSPGGLSEFQVFIQQSQTLETLTANNSTLTAFAEEPPILLNEDVLKGRYRWVYDVPVTMTFVPQGINSYRSYDPVNQFLILRIQVGRIAPGQNDEDVVIETFEVRDNPDR